MTNEFGTRAMDGRSRSMATCKIQSNKDIKRALGQRKETMSAGHYSSAVIGSCASARTKL
eukprot:CAMPEP_0194123626 /NCGR_PEP_ID=MMETSP0150-20130528/55222_1 /TAXON_ID=122233 /ORGANISM="Chaetoceros debilis, Strain MM31A-1" /LENGTH=59 /DNA_ID=CAMNT_0038816949 /DNA_START=124 /DNA_END=303 /DNA_ORIENTATION=-